MSSLSLSQIDVLSSHPGLEDAQGNQLDLSQIVSVFPLMLVNSLRPRVNSGIRKHCPSNLQDEPWSDHFPYEVF